ncbi:MAG: D-alanyl-D-alanine carboxypeptidase/D-alanyl-D-alanine-endopeptidase [Nitrosomonadales bacterium]|nr:D-alanyl-D-alanine carboxypeptidase/D-alanyl-D-alanine-endopeptidase [Nitrosomonadales bacterium]
MKRLNIFFLFFCIAVGAQAEPLPTAVTQELKKVGIPRSSIAVEVREVGKHSSLISLNAQRAMNPASVMKLVTTYAALDLLGPAYTWKTEAWIDGELRDGVLDGNLILKGYGDPKFTIEQFWLWLRELRDRGLREIRGDLILDRSHFDLPTYDPAEFDSDPVRAYNVGPDALLLNFNTLRFRYTPDGNGMKVITEPRLEGLTFDNQLVPHPPSGDCDGWNDTILTQATGDSVVLQGGYPSDCGEREQSLSILPHTRYVESVFRAVWKEVGGTLNGGLREAAIPADAQLFSTHRSEPLSGIIRDINKFSNNVMARQLFLTLGSASYKPSLAAEWGMSDVPLNTERSIETVQNWLQRLGLDFPELVLENGAGLSRKERISARHMAQMLQSAADHPLYPELQSSLPILGVDGSVKRRLKESPAASHAHLKTGTLDGVRTLAGYVRSKSGREWIVVFFINHHYAKAGQEAQDALIEWLARK